MNILVIRKMRWRCLPLAALLPLLLSGGCASMSNTDKGVLAGGGLGAGTGALIGSATGHTGLGAAVGGIVGAVSGGLVGNAVDNAEKKAEARALAANAPPALQPTDIVQMAYQHVSDDIIISQIRSTGSVYHLTAQEIVWLKQNGVSDVVIHEMQATATRPVRRVYSPAPAYPAVYERVYVVEPPPPPPPRVRLGVGYTWHDR
jgi:Glycine zipper